MKKNFELWMTAIDDAYLEEAAIPAKKKKNYKALALAAAACLVLVSTSLLRHGRVSSPPSITPEELKKYGYTFELPEDATKISYGLLPEESAVPSQAEVHFTSHGNEYTLRASKTDEATDLSGQEAADTPPLVWAASGLDFKLCSTSVTVWVDWYDSGTGTQWCLLSDAAHDTLALLTTAEELVKELGYNVAVAPDNATDITYNAFLYDSLTVAETTFYMDNNHYSYRMAATWEITSPFADISGTDTDYASHVSAEVGWCPAEIYFNEGGAGKIIWFDIVPGLLYSLTRENGASEETLLALANELFSPAQGDAG